MSFKVYGKILKSVCLMREITFVTHKDMTARLFSTTAHLSKRTPHTVGVMSWIRAARRRKYLERMMREKKKSQKEVLKEEMLKRTEPNIEFLATNRLGQRMNEKKMFSHILKPNVFLTSDRQTVICYHPPSPNLHPIEFTKPALNEPRLALPVQITEHFKDSLTDKEMEEAKMLMKKDPYLWNYRALSALFKTRPIELLRTLPLTDEQADIKARGQKIMKTLSLSKQKKQKQIQNWEREKYAKESRGKVFAKWFLDTLEWNRRKEPIPPKLPKYKVKENKEPILPKAPKNNDL